MPRTRSYFVKTYISLLFALTITACSGSSDDNQSETTPAPSTLPNQAPTVTNFQTSLADPQGINGETITISVNVSDDDTVETVSCELGDETFALSLSEGTTYSGEFTLFSFGEFDLSCSASDGDLSTSTDILPISVFPSTQETFDFIVSSCLGVFTGESIEDARCKNSDDTTFAYSLGELSEAQLEFNARPVGEDFQYILPVSLSVQGVSIAEAGTVFASEQLSENQLQELVETGSTQYFVNVDITDNLETSETEVSVMGVVNMQGRGVSVACDAFPLYSEDGLAYLINDEDILASLNGFVGEEETLLACQQTVTGIDGLDVESPLYASVKFTYSVQEGTAPVVSLDSVEFSQTLEDTPRDVGTVCATGTATDGGEIVSETFELITASGNLEMTFDENGKYCASLEGTGGQNIVVRYSATDNLGLERSIDSQQYSVHKNTGPEYVSGLNDVYCNRGDVVRLNAYDAQFNDLEGDLLDQTIVVNGVTRSSNYGVLCKNGTEYGVVATDGFGESGESPTFGIIENAPAPNNPPTNTAPVYVSGIKNIGCTNGDTINMGSAVPVVFSDADGDLVTTTYSTGNIFSCVNTGGIFDPIVQQNYTVTGSDGNGGNATSPSGTIFVCATGLIYDGSGGCL